MKSLKKLFASLFFVALITGFFWRVKLHFVPAGARIQPFLFASTETHTSTSPSGEKLHYRFNDAGAAHRGYHYTWCYRDHWLTGKKVIASGYSLPEVRNGEKEFPITWHEAGHNFRVRFTAGRRDSTVLWHSGSID